MSSERIQDEGLVVVRAGWRRALKIAPGEGSTVLVSALFFFFILAAYYMLMPVRDEIVTREVRDVPWLWTGTFIGTLAAAPLFTALVCVLPRRLFIPITYRFFAVNMLIFLALFLSLEGENRLWPARIFYIWLSVFNLFAVSIFWAFASDIFTTARSKRLFGLIGVGGTAGGVVGGLVTKSLLAVENIDVAYVFVAAAISLELAVRCFKWLARAHDVAPRKLAESKGWTRARSFLPDASPGGMLAGLRALAHSRYLMGVAAYILLLSLTATAMYLQRVQIIGAEFPGDTSAARQDRTNALNNIYLLTNIATIVIQCFFTGRIIQRVGVGFTLVLLPAISFGAIALVAAAPVYSALAIAEIARRTSNFALARPARETLYTVVSREERYKTKSVIDTAVYRGGDMMWAWFFEIIQSGLATTALKFAAVIAIGAAPLAALWGVLGLALGRRQTQLSREQDAAEMSIQSNVSVIEVEA